MSDIVAESGRVADECVELCNPVADDAACLLRELADIVSKLPVTADGVRVVPKLDRVWYLSQSGFVLASENIWRDTTQDGSPWMAASHCVRVSNCYSTREAAERSRQ